jgi:hypothetical protein
MHNGNCTVEMHNGNYIVKMFNANCKVEIVEWKLESENA